MDNIKYIKYLISVLLLMLILTGCKDDSNHVIGTNPNEFGVFPVAIPVSTDGGTYELKITGNGAWTAALTESNSSVANWCVLSETSGIGGTVITVTVQPSSSFVKLRSVYIEVTSLGKTLKSRVLQDTQRLGENEVLINGLVWSTVNIGEPGTFVDSPDDWGMWYQFNRKVGYPGGTPDDPVPENWPAEYINDGTNWLPENDPSPEGWRVPTAAEMVALWQIGATQVSPEQSGFSCMGMIVGIPEELALTANKDNLKQLGGLFLPKSGWRTAAGIVDRDWLVVVRTATALSETHGGMTMGGWGYFDLWGWGDGQKPRAAMIRPVKILEVED